MASCIDIGMASCIDDRMFRPKYPSCTARTEEYIWRSCDNRYSFSIILRHNHSSSLSLSNVNAGNVTVHNGF